MHYKVSNNTFLPLSLLCMSEKHLIVDNTDADSNKCINQFKIDRNQRLCIYDGTSKYPSTKR